MTLALIVAFLAHPLAWLLALAGAGLIGLAVNAAGPVLNFGAFTTSTYSQILALGTYLSSFAAGVTTGVIPANILTGGVTVYLLSAATTPGNQTTRTAAQLFADAAAQFGVSLTDPALANGFQYELNITQTGGGTFTLVAGTGVTLVGATQTVATNTSRTWVVNLLPTTATFTSVGTGTFS